MPRGGLRVVLDEGERALRGCVRREHRGRRDLRRDLAEPVAGVPDPFDVGERRSDLRLGREHPSTREAVERRPLEAPPDRRERCGRVVLRQSQERQPGLWIVAQLLRAGERCFGSLQVPQPQSHFAELVPRQARMDRAHGGNLVARAARLVLRFLEVAGHPQQLAAVDPADPRETMDPLPLEPPVRSVGPLEASAVVREVATEAHHVGEDGSGRVATELASGGRRRRLFHEPISLGQPSLIHEEHRAAHHAPRSEIPVRGAVGDLQGAVHQPERPGEIAARPRRIGVRDRQVAVDHGRVRERLGSALEQMFGAPEPARRDGVLHVREVLAPQRERTHRGSLLISAFEVRGVGGLTEGDRPARISAPIRGLRVPVEVVGIERAGIGDGGVQLVRAIPRAIGDARPRLLQRALGRPGCVHPLMVPRPTGHPH